MNVNSSAEMRKRATDWLNSKDRDIDSGIKILESAGYKPDVMKIFRKNIYRRDIPQKVVQEVRNYLRYYVSPNSDIHIDILPDENVEILKKVGQDLKGEYPSEIKKVVEELSDIYKLRGIFHNNLSKVGEDNTLEQKSERRRILAGINACSSRITILSEVYQKFKFDGSLPSDEILDNVFDPDKIKLPEDSDDQVKVDNKFVIADTVEALKKQSEGWRIKISKANNKLIYQNEKRLDKQNPMPDGPKRIALEKKIAKLKDEKLQIDSELAKKK